MRTFHSFTSHASLSRTSRLGCVAVATVVNDQRALLDGLIWREEGCDSKTQATPEQHKKATTASVSNTVHSLLMPSTLEDNFALNSIGES